MKHTRLLNAIKFPNLIMLDTQLTYSALCVAVTLYAYRNHLGMVRLGLRRLARLSGCSIETVRKALTCLEDAGHISIYRNYAWSNKHGHPVRHKDTIICRRSTQADFTFIPRAALQVKMRKSSFVVYLLICRLSGNGSRAYPSLRHMADMLGMGLSTICRAVQELNATNLLHAEHCIKRNGAHTSNSYYLVHAVQRVQRASANISHSICTVTPLPSVTARSTRLRAAGQHMPLWVDQLTLSPNTSWYDRMPSAFALPDYILPTDSPGYNPLTDDGVFSFLAN